MPSMSESDLTMSGRYRVRKDSIKKRPVSDLLSGKKNIVEGLPPLGVSGYYFSWFVLFQIVL